MSLLLKSFKLFDALLQLFCFEHIFPLLAIQSKAICQIRGQVGVRLV